MRPAFICVAGIDPNTGAHVRPVVAGQLPVGLLQRNGGPFDVGRVVDLGPVRTCGTPPEVEDQLFNPSAARAIGNYQARDFWRLLTRVAQPRLRAIFGRELQAIRNGAAVTEGTGASSLGCLVPVEQPVLLVNPWGKVRIQVSDGDFDLDLSITDVRFHEYDQWPANVAAVQDVATRIRAGVRVVLSVGLARAFQAKDDTERRHWLQVNGVHLEDDPVWQYT
jgi:hypothetical protein